MESSRVTKEFKSLSPIIFKSFIAINKWEFTYFFCSWICGKLDVICFKLSVCVANCRLNSSPSAFALTVFTISSFFCFNSLNFACTASVVFPFVDFRFLSSFYFPLFSFPKAWKGREGKGKGKGRERKGKGRGREGKGEGERLRKGDGKDKRGELEDGKG